MSNKFSALWHMVGNTPLIEILYQYQGQLYTLYAKCEQYNLTGSIKDRMALYILDKAYAEGHIKAGDRIVEATSGNTGISFSAIGKALGHDVTIIMPDWLSRERIEIIRSLGSEVVLVSKEQGGFLGAIACAEKLATTDSNVFLPRQFENHLNVEAHRQTTGPEIWKQLACIGQQPQVFIAGVGTGGTIMGVADYLKTMNPAIRVHPLEPAESPTLSTGYKMGSHRIQGISDEFIPSIVKLRDLNEVISVNDGDAILMAQKMARTLGLAVGISAGANILGAIKLQQQLLPGAVVVTVLPDSNKKYLSTDLTRKEPVRGDYLSTGITLLDYTPVRR